MLNLVFVVCCKLAQLTATINDLTLGYFMMHDFARDQDCCTVPVQYPSPQKPTFDLV